jgi:hypothetical protein
MPITPLAEFSEFLYLDVANVAVILHWEAFGVKDAHVAAKPVKDSGSFKSHKARI